jgi:hypothetical protein
MKARRVAEGEEGELKVPFTPYISFALPYLASLSLASPSFAEGAEERLGACIAYSNTRNLSPLRLLRLLRLRRRDAKREIRCKGNTRVRLRRREVSPRENAFVRRRRRRSEAKLERYLQPFFHDARRRRKPEPRVRLISCASSPSANEGERHERCDAKRVIVAHF